MPAAEPDPRRDSGRDADGYADLRAYAAIGDGRTIGLVALDGRIDWLPLPGFDTTPAFAALLDAEHGGYVALQPTEAFTVERAYVSDTNVLTTTFTTASGSVRVTDSLNTGISGRLPWAELARRVDGLDGRVQLRAVIAPGTRFNTASPWVQDTSAGVMLRLGGLTMAVRTLGEESVEVHNDRIDVTIVASPGSRHLVGLVATEREPLLVGDPADLDARVDRTIEGWQAWSKAFECESEWEPAVRRATLALKLLICAHSGAVLAAATTSLPESLTACKNWDYRYAWVRDTAYALTALFRFGLREETHAAISWLLRTIRIHGPEPHVLYTIDGEPVPADVVEQDVPGWRGIGPVVVGNQARDQLQLGVYGDIFSIVQLYVDDGNILDDETGRLLASVADRACDAWRRPDSGMWELPEVRHYTTSKLGCWHALTNAVHLAEIGQIPGDPARWRSEAERIRTWVDDHAWSPKRGAYVWYPGTDDLDASILLHAISGFDRSERMSSTLDALQEELGDGPHLFRYTGAAKEEGAFVACSFWMVSALAFVGRTGEAEERMRALVETTNDVGLLGEMIDPQTGDFLGNLPQALSLLALVNAALTLEGPLT